MNNKFRHLSLSFSRLLQGGLAATLAVVLLAFSVASNAQETSTVVRGTVTGPDGAAAAGEAVSITDTRTGSVRRTTTNDSGAFTVRGLPVGGPYTIRVTSSQYQDAQITDVYTNLSAAASFTIPLGAASETIDEIVVLASQVATADLAIGPGTSFSLEEIQAMPSSARQIRDIVRLDPRVTIERQGANNGAGINCLGGSARSNAITIDGVIASDGFGLNDSSGTAGRFSFPVPYDTIASAAVEFAPLDVQYSQFTGCAVNIVTKPGSNEFHGSAFYLYNDQDLTGTRIGSRDVITDPFEDKTMGFDLSGPIIKDKLFFTVAYEKFDDVGTQNTGPTGAGFANEIGFIDVDTVNQIADVMRTSYGRDPGFIVRQLPFESESIFARLDWNINDQHRAELTYSDLSEENLDPDDCCFSSFNGYTMSDNFEIEGIDRDTIGLRLYSNWTDNLSTLITYSFSDVIDKQGPLGGGEQQNPNPKPRLVVQDGDGDAIFTSGPGINRSANDLAYDVEQIKLSADYVLGDHTLTFGFERETREIYNLYIFDATGTIVFADIDDLIAGQADSIAANGSYTQDPLDASATFGRDVDSFYLQDEWQVNDVFTVVAGVRWDEYKSSDDPNYNPNWEARYGFSNQSSFEGLDLVQPRIGFTWDLPTSSFGSTQLTAGFGVFGGGDPTVHFANSYQNFGGAIGNGQFGGFDNDPPCTAADLDIFNGGSSWDGVMPNCVYEAAQNQALNNNGSAAALDPDYELPSNERWSIGIHHLMQSGVEFFDGWEMRLDFIETKHKNAIDWVDLRLTPSGNIFPDGRQQFYEVDPLLEDCNATFAGIRQGFTGDDGIGGDCDDVGNSNQDLLMTNGVEGSTTSVAFQMAKTFDFSDRTSLDVGIGYSYLDAVVGNPVTSFTAGSSYENTAKTNINDVELGPAFWASKHNIVLSARFKHYWSDNNATSVGFFFSRRSGRPYSWTYEDDTVEDLFGDSDDEENILIYVPTGQSDPAYDWSEIDQEDVDAFFAFLDSSGLNKYAGGIAPKNGFEGKWSSDLDIRISQEIGLFGDHQLQLFLDIENALNLFGHNKNVRNYNRAGDVPEALRTLELDDGSTDVYEVTDIFFENTNNIDTDDTVYRVQLGISYRF
jgi:outer membrane receptor for ferrienterochelin and colicin